MKRFSLYLTICLLAAGCHAPTSEVGAAPSSLSPSASPTAGMVYPQPATSVDLTGEWSAAMRFGDPRLLTATACLPALRWHLVQSGDRVRANIESLPDLPNPDFRFQEVVEGRLAGMGLHLTGKRTTGGRTTDMSYTLTYDPVNGFLHGDLNGTEFRAYRTAICADAPASPGPEWVTGRVYDEEGAPVSAGVTIYMQSQHADRPFANAVSALEGAFAVNDVPAGTQLVWMATKPGWTTRTYIETILPFGTRHFCDFGGGRDAQYFGRYFLSNKPEITAIRNHANVADRMFKFTLSLSEPLDESNRVRLAKAVTLVPANDAALIDRLGGTFLNTPAAPSAPQRLSDLNHYLSTVPSTNAESHFPLTCLWDESGQAVEVTGELPPGIRDPQNARYDVALFARDASVVDPDGNRLGTTALGAFDEPLNRGDLIFGAFYSELTDRYASASAPFDNSSKETRWRDTHRASMRVR